MGRWRSRNASYSFEIEGPWFKPKSIPFIFHFFLQKFIILRFRALIIRSQIITCQKRVRNASYSFDMNATNAAELRNAAGQAGFHLGCDICDRAIVSVPTYDDELQLLLKPSFERFTRCYYFFTS